MAQKGVFAVRWSFAIASFILLFSIVPLCGAADPAPQIINSLPQAPRSRSVSSQISTPPSNENKGIPAVTGEGLNPERPSLIMQAVAISGMALLPFAVMLLSPFLKFVVVLSLLRTALGVQNSPPNMIINGIAILMSLFIMYPTVSRMYEAAQPIIMSSQMPESLIGRDSPGYIIKVAEAGAKPLKEYIKDNSLVKHQRLFFRMIYRNLPENIRTSITPDDFIVLVPAYITSQLKDAFEIGVLIYIPFFVIDMVVSNILLAMGMMMLSPVTISMPLKLFLLVMLDGWTILIEGLVQTFK